MNNRESLRYAERIAEVLKDCGFSPLLQSTEFSGSRQGEGLLFSTYNDPNPPPHAVAILHAFQAAEIMPISTETNAHVNDPYRLIIFVLSKPEK